jgi:phage-related protein
MNGTAGGHFHLTNVTDNNRNFSMTALSPSEVITIDNDLQIVTSTLNTLILNKITPPVTFFRLLSGKNELFLDGNINTSTGVTITYTPMKRMA